MSRRFLTKAQAGFEFIALVGFMFMIFVVFLGIINQRTVEFQEQKNQQSLRDMGDVIKKEIDLATKAEPGYSRTFNLPSTINSKHYNATIQKGGLVTNIILTFYDFSSQYEYVVKVPYGVFAQGIGQGDNLIEKNESLIVLNKAEITETLEIMQEQQLSTLKENITSRGPQQVIEKTPEDPSANDVAYWKFNEQSGETPDTSVLDSTPNNHRSFTQTAQQKVEFVAGLSGNALQLDGKDDSIKVENSNKLNFAGGNFTIMGWIKTDKIDSVILSKDSYDADEGWGVSIKNGKLSYSIYGAGGAIIDDSGTKQIADNNWHHIAIIRETDKYKFYVDGTLNSGKTSTAIGAANNFDLRIGYKNKDYVQGTDVVNNVFVEKNIAGAFSGKIDELKIYSKIIQPDEITAEYVDKKDNIPIQVTYPDYLVAYWKLDGNGKDEIGNYDGTITGTFFDYQESLMDKAPYGNAEMQILLTDNGLLQTAEEITLELSYYPGQGPANIVSQGVQGKGYYAIELPHMMYETYSIYVSGVGEPYYGENFQQPFEMYNHVIIVFKKDGSFKVYLNGKLSYQGTTGKSFELFKKTSTHNKVTLKLAEFDIEYAGNIFSVDEIKIYNRALSEDEINEQIENIKNEKTDLVAADAGADIKVGVNMPVKFDGSKSYQAQEYYWDIDASDGINFETPDLNGQKPEFKYLKDGNYEVTLKVKNEKGNTAQDTMYARVIPSLGQHYLVAPGTPISQYSFKTVVPTVTLDSSGFPVAAAYDVGQSKFKLTRCNDKMCAGGDEEYSYLDIGYVVYSKVTFDNNNFPVIAAVTSDNAQQIELSIHLIACNDAKCQSYEKGLGSRVYLPDYRDYGDAITLELDQNNFPILMLKEFISNNMQATVIHCNDRSCKDEDEERKTFPPYRSNYWDATLANNQIAIAQGGKGLSIIRCSDLICETTETGVLREETNNQYQYGVNYLKVNKNDMPVFAFYGGRYIVICNDRNCDGNDENWRKIDNLQPISKHRIRAIELDNDNIPAFIFFNSDRITYMHCKDTECKTNIISKDLLEPFGVSHRFANLVMDSGNPVISVYANNEIKFIRCKDPDCIEY